VDLLRDFVLHWPSHPAWFWAILLVPYPIWFILWVVARTGRLSLKPLTPWLKWGYFISAPIFLVTSLMEEHRLLRLVCGSLFYGLGSMSGWIQSRYRYETLRVPSTKWYKPWKAVRFSIPGGVRIRVQDIDSVSPWYVGKLGLRRLVDSPGGEPEVATYEFKQDGNSLTLTTKNGFGTDKTPILFTKKIGKMRDVLSSRGVDVGTIERDRQGIQYFEIHDPEGNVIEVVEGR
jgi:hypothetical protein